MGNLTVTQMQVVSQATPNSKQVVEQVALFAADGTPLLYRTTTNHEVASDVKLTGYTVAASKLNVAATDDVMTAIGKLEKRLVLGSL